MWLPNDGVVNPTDVAMALSKKAREMGTIYLFILFLNVNYGYGFSFFNVGLHFPSHFDFGKTSKSKCHLNSVNNMILILLHR